MKQRLLPALALVAILAGFGWTGPQDIDVTGTWVGKTEVPDIGAVTLTLVLKKTETGYAGTLNDDMGVLAKDTPLTKIKLEGDKLTFAFPIADGGTVEADLKVEGKKLTGLWIHEAGGSGALAFEPKK